LKALEAMPEAISHQRAFDKCDCYLCEDCLDEVEEWEIEYEAWAEKPMGSPCIFDTKEPCKFSDSILQQPWELTSVSHHVSSC
jgi:hypothetical protein